MHQMQNSPNHKGSTGDFARSQVCQCKKTVAHATLDPEHRKIALVYEILFRNMPCSSREPWAISLEHGSEHPSDLDTCSHLLASVFIADSKKAAPGKISSISSGEFM